MRLRETLELVCLVASTQVRADKSSASPRLHKGTVNMQPYFWCSYPSRMPCLKLAFSDLVEFFVRVFPLLHSADFGMVSSGASADVAVLVLEVLVEWAPRK